METLKETPLLARRATSRGTAMHWIGGQWLDSSELGESINPATGEDPPLPDLLAQGIVWIPWRVENVHIGTVFGKETLNVSPRVRYLHIHVDDLPWLWADFSNNPIDVALLPPGQHKIRIELVNAIHQGAPGQSKTVTFTIPKGASPSK